MGTAPYLNQLWRITVSSETVPFNVRDIFVFPTSHRATAKRHKIDMVAGLYVVSQPWDLEQYRLWLNGPLVRYNGVM